MNPNEKPEEAESWELLGDISDEASDLSQDILEQLKALIDAGRVKISNETDRFFHLIGSKYPIGVNRIEWRCVRDHLFFDVLPTHHGGITRDEEERKLAECRSVLVGWFKVAGIDLKDRAVWVGDDSGISVDLTVDTLLEVYPGLFSCPQHSYVLPLTGNWCLNYTMEGSLFFGMAENADARGCVNSDEPS